MPKNVLYAQAGGITAVINASAAAVLETAKQHPETFGTVYGAINGIVGVLEERLVDMTQLSNETIEQLKTHPGAAFQACRFDLDPLEKNPEQYERVLTVLRHYDIGYFFYNGGNGSMVTAQKVSDYCTSKGHPVICIGIAKTIDNDLAISHCSPGFGSAAKYIASSLVEIDLDLKSMHNTSTKFLSFEAMGRNTGWLTIAGGLVKLANPNIPLLVLPAERAFNKDAFLTRVKQLVTEKGYCLCIVSEGLHDEQGNYVSIANVEHTHLKDYTQLGGVADALAHMVSDHFGCKTHSVTPDYLQRSASHFVSEVDWQMAYHAGKSAVEAALNKEHGVLPIIEATNLSPFEWRYKTVDLMTVADLEKTVPDHFLTDDGMDVTDTALSYLAPLIEGERQVCYSKGVPLLKHFQFTTLTQSLPPYTITK